MADTVIVVDELTPSFVSVSHLRIWLWGNALPSIDSMQYAICSRAFERIRRSTSLVSYVNSVNGVMFPDARNSSIHST